MYKTTPSDEASSTEFGKQGLPYRQLESNDLRLLTVDPLVPDGKDNLIRCSLQQFSLKDLNSEYQSADDARFTWGDYIAISYCWGWDAENPSQEIAINGYAVAVTESLEAALQSIRGSLDQNRGLYPVKYWIDAICINQADKSEKEREILRMKDIYGQSKAVFVHLGPEMDDSALGIKFLKRTAAELASGVDCGKALLGIRFSPGEEYRNACRAVIKLICRPYWYRVWILQELAMSNGNISVGCGAHEVDFKDIVQVTRLLSLNAETLVLITGAGLETEYARLMTSMWVAMWTIDEQHRRQRAEVSSRVVTYLDLRLPLLTLAQNAQATKAHDKIYGVLGMMPDSIRSKMKPYVNYDLSTDAVFTAFSRAVIEVTGDLDIVFAKNFDQAMRPSWATDWTLQFDRAGFPHDWLLYCYDHFDGAYPDLPEVIVTSRKRRADVGRKSGVKPFDSSDSLLRCSGFKIGNIDGMAPYMLGHGAHDPTPDGTFVQSTCRTSPYGDDADTRRALIHTVFANPVWGDDGGAALFQIPWLLAENSPMLNDDGSLFVDDRMKEVIGHMNERGESWQAVFSNNFFIFEWWRRRISQFLIGGKRFMDYFARDVNQCAFPRERIRLDIATALGASVGRRLVTMSSGHFGGAPRTAQEGDSIFVILGCSLPIVLRPVVETGYYEVVGECYVEGFANGEGVEGLDRGEYQLQEIILC